LLGKSIPCAVDDTKSSGAYFPIKEILFLDIALASNGESPFVNYNIIGYPLIDELGVLVALVNAFLLKH
jgi:hypothetical protein